MNPVIATNGNDLYPIKYDCLKNSLNSYRGFTTSLKKRKVNLVNLVMSSKKPFNVFRYGFSEDSITFSNSTSPDIFKSIDILSNRNWLWICFLSDERKFGSRRNNISQ